MDEAVADSNEQQDRPQRVSHLPSHLEDYVVGYHPTQVHSPASPHAESKHRSHSRKTSNSVSSCSSRSGRHSVLSTRFYPSQALSPVQTATLEENIKQRQLECVRQEIEEDLQADLETQQLQAKVRAAQQAQEEALQAKEALTKRLERSRRLKQAETDLELAKLVKSMLTTDNNTISPEPLSSSVSYIQPSVQVPETASAVCINSAAQPTVHGELKESVHALAPLQDRGLSMQPIMRPPVSQNLIPFLPSSHSPVSSSAPPPVPQNMAQDHQPTPMSQHAAPNMIHTGSLPQPLFFPATVSLPPATIQSEPIVTHAIPCTSQVIPAAVPYPGLSPQPGTELLIASAYGIPRPTLPVFESGRESDFALLKMALDNLLNSHIHLSEQYKYQVLLSQLKLSSALQLAKAYIHHPHPYSAALQALREKYGQPRQLVQSELGAILNTPPLKMGDAHAFDSFALSVQSLVGMLQTLEGQNGCELMCGSHVDRLLSKMPASYRDSFVEYCLNRGILQSGTDKTYTLPDLAAWLQVKSQAKRISSRAAALFQTEPPKPNRKDRGTSHFKERSVPVLLTVENDKTPAEPAHMKHPTKAKPYCPHCDNREHYLNSCDSFKKLNTQQIVTWLKDGKRCQRCGRNHMTENCNLKRPCKICRELHLTVLHDAVHETSNAVLLTSSAPTKVYLDRPNRSQRVMLKVVKVLIHNGDQSMEAHAILDDGSERTIVLSPVIQHLKISGTYEVLPLQTVHQDVKQLEGLSVSLEVSPLSKPTEKYHIPNAFSAHRLSLAEHNYPVTALQQTYQHLRGLPLTLVERVQPLLLIGSDMPHLITPVQPICQGPSGGPVAICTRLGWSLQGPMTPMQTARGEQQCLHITTASSNVELLQHVQRLWQIDTLPYCEKAVTRSKLDQQAYTLLQTATRRVNTDGVQRYATPLLRRIPTLTLQAPKEAVLPSLRSTERRLAREPTKAETYCSEIYKLEMAGYVTKISPEEANKTTEAWYIPHHMVHHNGKDRIVFNCSFQYQGQSLNEQLLPGPTLGPSLLGVLLRFRQHAVAVSGDIRSMFHQVRLLPEDRSVLRFIWRNMQREEEPTIYEWQVLPFGTTCSPCCAIYALQCHSQNHDHDMPGLAKIVAQAFYVDNCLYSTSDPADAKAVVDGLRQLLADGGFEIRQWASNHPSVVEHLPTCARSTSSELWLSHNSTDLQEPTLGMQWNCLTDMLGYRHRTTDPQRPTLRNLYKILASQYDPLGYIVPFTTRAKVLIQDLWKQDLAWDDVIEPQHLRDQWTAWEAELPNLQQVQFPRPFAVVSANAPAVTRELHVFCDASERAYGSVAYLRTTTDKGEVHMAFVLARSRVAPKKCLSMPRLELSAALTGAQLVKILLNELTLSISQVVCWSDSTTVLYWLKSESCRYKVFVGTRVTEIQTLTEGSVWRYVDSGRNPADHITRGLTLSALVHLNQWKAGPDFLKKTPEHWPAMPNTKAEPDQGELKKGVFVGMTSVISDSKLPDPKQFHTWKELIQATVRSLHGAADTDITPDASAYIAAERINLAQAQLDSFPGDVKALKAKRPIPSDSRLTSLAPEYEEVTGLIRVGGRLRQAVDLEVETLHPIVLDPGHPITKLLIKDCDEKLHHPGAERVLAELHRQYWILRGREAIRKHQHTCKDCQFWRAKPQGPKMADLPPSRLRLYKPPFYSTGVDCFGPFSVSVGRHQEKRWGVLYKCMTTRCVHLDLLENLNADTFLLSLRRLVARRGKPFELLCDNGTNFTGGCRELTEAFKSMAPHLQDQLAEQKIKFKFNPPAAPHFGGTWEREVRSVKTALRVVLRAQSVPESVLQTLLIEVEGILNAKPLGYVSSDMADLDPITPNMLLMGRRDSSLPQALYDNEDLLGKRRWRHSQVLADNFWTSFIRLYLPSLHHRQKWRTDGKEPTPGQVVLIVDQRFPRALWPVGTVAETFRGADGRVRSATVKVKDKLYTRPVIRLVQLPQFIDEA